MKQDWEAPQLLPRTSINTSALTTQQLTTILKLKYLSALFHLKKFLGFLLTYSELCFDQLNINIMANTQSRCAANLAYKTKIMTSRSKAAGGCSSVLSYFFKRMNIVLFFVLTCSFITNKLVTRPKTVYRAAIQQKQSSRSHRSLAGLQLQD